MGKKKSQKSIPSVFKIAGAKSLKKTKAKAVNLGLKNIKQKVQEMDKQFLEVNKKSQKLDPKPQVVPPQKRDKSRITQEQIARTADEMVKMDL